MAIRNPYIRTLSACMPDRYPPAETASNSSNPAQHRQTPAGFSDPSCASRRRSGPGRGGNPPEAARLQRCAADECAVDLVLREQCRGIGGVDAAAIENGVLATHIATDHSIERGPHDEVRLTRLLGSGHAPRAD